MADQYLILKNIRISNANAIAGFTYGFPAVSHFLGYVHALSRKLQPTENIRLHQVGIVCHHHQIHAYRDSIYEPYAFALTRNPLTKEGKTAPINEEGRMQLTVSLIIKADGINIVSEQSQKSQCVAIKTLAEQHKLAGGRIDSIDSCYVAKESEHKAILRRLLPGFILRERSDLLAEKNQLGGDKLQNWLDFSALTFRATDQPLSDEEGCEQVQWQQIAKPKGYLVPIQIGFKKIASTYDAGEVANVRDNQTPVSFVEPIHSIGEWVGTPRRLGSLQEIMWHYHYQSPFYLCRTQSSADESPEPSNIPLPQGMI